jgi:ribosomal protein S16
LKLDDERYGKWLKVGAQPSGTLAAVIRRVKRAAAALEPGAKKTA